MTKIGKTVFTHSPLWLKTKIFDEFHPIFNNFEDIFDGMISKLQYKDNFGGSLLTNWSKKPAMNVSNTEKEYIIELSVPGLSKEDIKIEFSDNTLTVKGKKKTEKTDKKTGYSYSEFSYDTFERVLELPEDANVLNHDNIKATHNNGVLTLTIPKRQKKEDPKKVIREIKIS